MTILIMSATGEWRVGRTCISALLAWCRTYLALCATADSVSFAHAGAALSGALMIPLGLDADLGAGLVSEAALANFVGW